MKIRSYKVSTIDGDENIYGASLTIVSGVMRFSLYRGGRLNGKEIIFPLDSVYRVETINKEQQVSDGAQIVSNREFKQFSQTVEAYDAYLNGDDDFFDPAS